MTLEYLRFLVVRSVETKFLPSKGSFDCKAPIPTCNNTPTTAITIVACIGSSPNTSMNQILENYSKRSIRKKKNPHTAVETGTGFSGVSG